MAETFLPLSNISARYQIIIKSLYKQNNSKNMKITIDETEARFLVTLDGEMDTAAAAEAEELLRPLYKTNGKDVVIECERLEYIASSGLRILLSILKGAKAGGSKGLLRHVSDEIKDVFRLTGFISLFDFE